MGEKEDLEKRLIELEARLREMEKKNAEPPATAPPSPRPAATFTPAAATPAPTPTSLPAASPLPPTRPPAAPTPRAPPVDMEKVLGANWLARAGILVLSLGVVFFIKLAFDLGWIGLRTRIVLGVLGGLLLFALGDVLRDRRTDPAFGQILSAGGAIIAYVALYLSYSLPEYRAAFGLTVEGAVTMLALTSALLMGYAAWRNLPLIASVALVLGIVLLAPAGDFTTVGLLYALLLAAGTLVAGGYRGKTPSGTPEGSTGSAWNGVIFLALLGGNLALFIGLEAGLNATLIMAGAAAHAAFSVGAASRLPHGDSLGGGTALLAPLLAAPLMGATFDRIDMIDPYGWALLGMGLAAVGAAFVVPVLARQLGISAGALLLVWPFVHFGFETSFHAPFAYEGLMAAALVLGTLLPRARNGLHGAATAAGAFTLFLLWVKGLEGAVTEQPLLASWVFFLLAALSLALWWTHRDSPQGFLRNGPLLVAIGSPVVLVAFVFEGWGITVSWALLAFLLVGAGFATNNRDLRMSAFAVFALVLVRIFVVDFPSFSNVNKVLAFVLTGLLLLGASYLYARNKDVKPAEDDREALRPQ